jgi:hypothetical protein
MFTVISQTTPGFVNYNITYDLHNGKKPTIYNGFKEKAYYDRFLENKKTEYIRKLYSNYVLHKKTLLQINCKHYQQTTQRLISLQATLQVNELINEEKCLVNICKRILSKEKDLVYIMEMTTGDGDRLTSILAFAKENSIDHV